MTTTLPAEWTTVLDRIQESLNLAIQEADAREASQAGAAPSLPDYREVVQATLRTRMEGLSDKVQALESVCNGVDALLAEGENALRQEGKAVIGLNQRLAEWLRRHEV
jgi:hypothetical protein